MAAAPAVDDARGDGYASGGRARADACSGLRAQLGLPARTRRRVEAPATQRRPSPEIPASAALQPRLARRLLLGDARLHSLRACTPARAAVARAVRAGRGV